MEGPGVTENQRELFAEMDRQMREAKDLDGHPGRICGSVIRRTALVASLLSPEPRVGLMREVYTELVRLCSVYFPEYKAELIEDEGYLMVDLRKGG